MKDVDIQRLWDEAMKAAGCRCSLCVGLPPVVTVDWQQATYDAWPRWEATVDWHDCSGLGCGHQPCICDGAPSQQKGPRWRESDYQEAAEVRRKRLAASVPAGLTVPIPDDFCCDPVRYDRGECCGATLAMSDSQTIVPAADDVGFIAKRLKELAAERAEMRKNSDPEQAMDKHLDQIGENWSVIRNPCEGDYTYRQRVLKKIRGEV